MYGNPQAPRDDEVKALRREGGAWLKQLREEAGLSQRELAAKLGVEYYTFISQMETGRVRVPPDQYRAIAKALKIDLATFVRKLMRFYDPVTYAILFAGSGLKGEARSFASAAVAGRANQGSGLGVWENQPS